MHRRMRTLASLIILLMAALTLGSCTSSDKAVGDKPKLIKEGQLVVAMSGEYRPFSYVESGKVVGFDVDIAQAIADELGLELVVKTAGYSTLVEGTASGRYDMLIASVTATPERARVVDFADGYYSSGAQLFVKKGQQCKSIKDLGTNPQLGVASGTTYDKYIKDKKITNRVKTFESDITALQDAATGRLDGAITDQLVGQHQIEEAGLDVEVCGDRLYSDTQAPAVAKGNPLGPATSEALKNIIDNGTYAKISEKYFGKDISGEIDNAPVKKVMADAESAAKPSFGELFVKYIPTFFKAAGLTLLITAVALAIAVVLGSGVAAMNMSSIKPLQWLAQGWIGLIRGTPLIAQLFVLYFGLTELVLLSGFWAGAIALAIHNSAYIAEIIRSGFQSVPGGLVEAARSLGMPRSKTLRRIQVPLATRNILPVLGNQFIIAVKDSSLVAFIGMSELFRTAQNMAAAEYSPLNAYLTVSVYYLIIVMVLTGLVHLLERKMNVDKKGVA